MLPPTKPGDLERMFWKRLEQTVPRDSRGKTFACLDELRMALPAAENYSELEVLECGRGMGYVHGYVAYGRRDKNNNEFYPVAYGCNKCHKFVLDKPLIRDVNTLAPLSGREGYDIYCISCYALLEEVTFKMS